MERVNSSHIFSFTFTNSKNLDVVVDLEACDSYTASVKASEIVKNRYADEDWRITSIQRGTPNDETMDIPKYLKSDLKIDIVPIELSKNPLK